MFQHIYGMSTYLWFPLSYFGSLQDLITSSATLTTTSSSRGFDNPSLGTTDPCYSRPSILYIPGYCKTPCPVQNLTLLSLRNKNKNNPHLISCKRGCPRFVKICVQTILSLIRWMTTSLFLFIHNS
jgi:hypothetical protein